MSGCRSKAMIIFVVFFWCFSNDCLLLTLGVSLIQHVSMVTDLYMIGLYPFHGAWNGGAAMLAGSQIALKQINERDDVLPNYRLNLLWNDTGCDPGVGVNIMFEHLYTPPTKIMIIGALCSIVAQATAQVSYLWNVVQLSPATTSPALSDKSRFKMYLRTNAPETHLNPAKIKIFKEFGWSNIATIHQTFDIFSVATDDLISLMKTSNINLVATEIVATDPAIQIQKLKARGARIIVGSFYADMAARVFCEAYKVGLYGPKIVWFLLGWYSDNWWKEKTASVECTVEEIEIAIDGYFSIDDVIINPKGDVTISGYTPQEIHEMYLNWTNHEELPALKLGLKGYDGIWAAALALNKTASDLEQKGTERLEDFTYDNADMAQLLFKNAMDTSFMGMRGNISFDDNGDLNAMYILSRLQNGRRITVGLYYSNTLEWLPETPVVWKGGKVPKDSVTVRKIMRELSSSLYISMCCMAGMGITLTCVFLAFNIGYRKSKIVKMSSPNLNHVTLVGCLILYGTVFLESSDTSRFLSCQAKLVTLTAGFSLAFGALFAKTWRVYMIFTHGTKQKKVVKDKQLLLMVCGLVTVNITIIIIWFVMDPFQIVIHQLPVKINVIEDLEIRESVKNCVSPKQIYFLGCLLTIQGIILLFGGFLALQTRKVKVDGLNDSKMIGVCIYNLVVLSFLGVTVSLTLKADYDVNYGITSCIIIVATTVTQCLIVVPKIIGHFSASQVHDSSVETVEERS